MIRDNAVVSEFIVDSQDVAQQAAASKHE